MGRNVQNAPMIGEARLRRATLDDVDELFAIHRAAMREYVAQAYGPWDDAWQQTFFRGHFDVDVRKVVLFDGEVAGYFDVLDKGDHLFVSELVIAPGCQRRGIGSELLRQTQVEAAGRRLPVRLQVLRINPAKALYERLGFEVCGQLERHWQMEWSYRSAAHVAE
jgi:ribosomal protein S18 acetylase RimI-like enzyme